MKVFKTVGIYAVQDTSGKGVKPVFSRQLTQVPQKQHLSEDLPPSSGKGVNLYFTRNIKAAELSCA